MMENWRNSTVKGQLTGSFQSLFGGRFMCVTLAGLAGVKEGLPSLIMYEENNEFPVFKIYSLNELNRFIIRLLQQFVINVLI